MNVFDFDNTIFSGDSTACFIRFEMLRRPAALLYLPKMAFYAFRYYALRTDTKTRFKEKMYSFLKVCDTEPDVKEFWKKHINRIKPFYKEISENSDVIISASPEFLLKPLEDRLGITVIASRVSPKDGTTDGENCYHAEKVRRFTELFGEAEIDSFYSDSYSDEPLAVLAKRAYIVDGDDILPWDFNKHKKKLRT